MLSIVLWLHDVLEADENEDELRKVWTFELDSLFREGREAGIDLGILRIKKMFHICGILWNHKQLNLSVFISLAQPYSVSVRA